MIVETLEQSRSRVGAGPASFGLDESVDEHDQVPACTTEGVSDFTIDWDDVAEAVPNSHLDPETGRPRPEAVAPQTIHDGLRRIRSCGVLPRTRFDDRSYDYPSDADRPVHGV